MGRPGALGALILASLGLALASAPAAMAVKPPLVTLHQTGGFAGVDELLTVKQNRRAVFTQRQGPTERVRVNRKRMHHLRGALRGWRKLDRRYPAPRPVSDGFTYTVSHVGYAVRTEDGAERPRKLQRVMAILQRIKNSAR